jgi:hypothetical protein
MSSGGSPPSAPDPTLTADQQIRVNQATIDQLTNANRSNQVGPTGSQTWAKDPATGQWTQTTTLSPQIDQQLQQQIINNDIGLGTQGNAMARLLNSNYAGGQMDLSGLPQGYGGQSLPRSPLVTGLNTGTLPGLQTGVASADPLTALDKSQVGNIQNSVAGAGGTGGYLDQAQNAVYGQMASRLDPQYNQAEEVMKSQLADQGIPQNSEAWNRAMDDFTRQKTDAYQSANNAAVSAGNALQNQLFGQRVTAGQFGNAAQDQAFNQALGSGTFTNSALGQLFQQGLASGTFGNQAQNQAFQQLLAKAGFTNQAVGQDFSQAAQQAQLGNAARQQALGEQVTQRQEPINEVNALKGGQVMAPSFGATDQVAGPAGAPNIGQLQNNAYQGQLNAYNAQVGSDNSTMGTVGSVLGMAMIAF